VLKLKVHNQDTAGTTIYNLALHPLSKYPRPKLWAAFRLTLVMSLIKGDVVQISRRSTRFMAIWSELPQMKSRSHTRTAERPNGRKKIYAYRPGHKPFPRNPIWWGRGGVRAPRRPESLTNAEDPADHQRMKKLLEHGLTGKALAAQEPTVQSYVEMLVK